MAELDTLKVNNPTEEEFSCRFNGEIYTIPAESEAFFPHFLAFHMAKHLSDKMLAKEIIKEKKSKTDNPYNPKVAQLEIYDNPRRRMTLYDILGTKDLVERCVRAFPFKDFVGEISEYDKYVEKKESKSLKEE